MKIMERVEYVKKALKEDFDAGGTLGGKLQAKGVDALLKGRTSAEWAAFMSLFADNAKQLNRLTGKDDQADKGYVRESTAYLLASSPCGGMTPTVFSNLMSPDIDQGLPTAPDGSITRPIPIKEPPDTEAASRESHQGDTESSDSEPS